MKQIVRATLAASTPSEANIFAKVISCFKQVLLRKMLGTRYGPVGTQFL